MCDNKETLSYEINEDSVQIHVFTKTSNSNNEFWENLCKEINFTLKSLSQNYIWHKDEFKLSLPILQNDMNAIPMHLTSTVCYGDNIEDEWYIVYLVMEISKKYKDLVIQIEDGDGDFMLIEAANYLPSWANPESTVNRVFVCNNAVHLIPPNLANLKNKIPIQEALQILQHFPEQTKVSSQIQEAITSRVGQYPRKLEDNFHRAIVNLPVDIAALFTLQPTLIAPIVTSYCNHDVIDAKACRTLNYSDCIPVEVKFTKCLYAMLMHTKILRNGINDFSKTSDKRNILGFKLTCGYQMIMKVLTGDIFCTKEYMNFKNNLQSNGYFKGKIENSVEYNILLDKAKKYFIDVECPINTFISRNISELMTTDDFIRCKATLISQKMNEKDMVEDSDDWLNIDPNQLNELLNNRYGNQVKFEKDEVIAAETITTKLTDFLKQTSDFEGVDTNKSEDTENDCIDFDAEEFQSCVEKMLKFLSTDINEINLQADSDLEYESDFSDEDNNTSELDKELGRSLNLLNEDRSQSKTVVSNLTQSMKEEGLSGPSSNLLTSIGINKTDLLDSDDD